MPPLDERLRLAERTMRALADGTGELPPKIGVHPRSESSFGHAMPARLAGGAAGGEDDLLGMKWVVGFPSNSAVGLPTIHAVVVLNDPRFGWPLAILDGGPITAQRTAAVSGVAIAAVRRRSPNPRVALIGAGVQARAHLPVLGQVAPGCQVTIYDRHPERAAAIVDLAGQTPGIGGAGSASDARSAVAEADIVVTCASFTTPDARQVMRPEWLGPNALVVAVDYATYASAAVARDAVLFSVDERAQFLANRDAGNFDGYPDPAATIGELLLQPREATAGRVLVTHLGVGLADVVFGAAILETARRRGIGTELPA